jgi:hypothetical protein
MLRVCYGTFTSVFVSLSNCSNSCKMDSTSAADVAAAEGGTWVGSAVNVGGIVGETGRLWRPSVQRQTRIGKGSKSRYSFHLLFFWVSSIFPLLRY